jgi:hypothetical protein
MKSKEAFQKPQPVVLPTNDDRMIADSCTGVARNARTRRNLIWRLRRFLLFVLRK